VAASQGADIPVISPDWYLSPNERSAAVSRSPGGILGAARDLIRSPAFREQFDPSNDGFTFGDGPLSGTPYRAETDALEAAAASDQTFYRNAEFNATNGFSAVAWHIGGLLNATGYDLAKTARGAYRLSTDSNTQTAAYNAIKFAANNPGVIANNAIQGFKSFANKPFAEQADSVFKFGAGGLATAGAGKLSMLAVDGAITGATATARWVAPKAEQLLESYMYRSGGLAYAVEPGPGFGLPKAGPQVIIGRDAVSLTEFNRLNVLDSDVGRLRPGEAGAAAELQSYLGGTLSRTPAGTSGDFVFNSGAHMGKTVDFMLTPDSFAQAAKINQFFEKNMTGFSNTLDLHLQKADLIPMDTRFLTQKK